MLVKRLLFSALSLVAVSAVLTACTTESTDPTTVELMLSKTWKLTALTAAPALVIEGVPITDVYASDVLSACDKHQKRKYNADSTITFSTDSAGCETPIGAYTWSLNGSTLVTTEPDTGAAGGVEVKTNTLVSINATTMVLSWNVSAGASPDGAAHVATETYTAQ